MSTAGKVLTVLVTLVAVVWVMLTAAVTELNRNGAKAVEDLQKKVASLEEDFTRTRDEFKSLKNATETEQVTTQDELTALQSRQSEVEKKLAIERETLARVNLQLQDTLASVKGARTLSDERLAEQKAMKKDKADKEAEVEKLKSENDELRGELTALQGHFKAKRNENRSLVDRLMKSGAKPSSRRATLTIER